jgi:hypothetical protein
VLLLGQPTGNSGAPGWVAGGAGNSHMGSKMTASEQLRLAKQQQQQASAQGFGFRSIWGSGSQVPSSSGSLSVLSGGARQASAGGAVAGGVAVAGSGGSPPQQQKRRFSHRRFASMPVNSA